MENLKVIRRELFLEIPLMLIFIEDNFNIRTDYGDLDSLALDIIDKGQLEPIKVQKILNGENKGLYKVIEGHRRTLAINIANEKYNAGIAYVNAIATNKEPVDQLLEMLSAGIHKKELNIIELAAGAARLTMQFNLSPYEVAKHFNKSHTYIYDLLILDTAPNDTKKLVIDGVVKYKDVVKLIKHYKDSEQAEKHIFGAMVGVTPDKLGLDQEGTALPITPEGAAQADQEGTALPITPEGAAQADQEGTALPLDKKGLPIIKKIKSEQLGLKRDNKVLTKMNYAISYILESNELSKKESVKFDLVKELVSELCKFHEDEDNNLKIVVLIQELIKK